MPTPDHVPIMVSEMEPVASGPFAKGTSTVEDAALANGRSTRECTRESKPKSGHEEEEDGTTMTPPADTTMPRDVEPPKAPEMLANADALDETDVAEVHTLAAALVKPHEVVHNKREQALAAAPETALPITVTETAPEAARLCRRGDPERRASLMMGESRDKVVTHHRRGRRERQRAGSTCNSDYSREPTSGSSSSGRSRTSSLADDGGLTVPDGCHSG